MAVANTSITSLMRKTIESQDLATRTKFKIKPKQVSGILKKCVEGNSTSYNNLLEILKICPFNETNFKHLIQDCSENVLLLDQNFTKLIECLCGIDWVDREYENVQLYSNFLYDLVTAHIYHTPLVIVSLLKLFKENGEIWEKKPSEKLLRKWSHIHSVIAQIILLIPMASDILMQAITDHYPYYKAGVFANTAFLHNLIWITKYIPSLTDHVMTVIINRLIVLDVNIDHSMSKSNKDAMYEMEVNEIDTVLIDTIDYCMLEMLNWLQDERDTTLPILCNVFEKIILPTYGTRYIQFLILYMVSISQKCSDQVLSNLWITAAGLNGFGAGAIATRRTAVRHLTGLLARCKRMPNSRLVHHLRSMTDWCHAYISAARESTSTASNKIHGAFYAVCHGVFYLVAFKHQHLFMCKESINFIESLNLARIVTCQLNPLKSCPPQVARAFSAVTRAHQLVYCQAIIERNKRFTLQQTVNEEIDDWFPYDPFTLPRSGELIGPLCTEYQECISDDKEENKYISRKRKLDLEDDDYLMATATRLSTSLSNCISPGFKS